MVVVCLIVRRHDTRLELALILHHRMIQINADILMYRLALLQSVYNDCNTMRRLETVLQCRFGADTGLLMACLHPSATGSCIAHQAYQSNLCDNSSPKYRAREDLRSIAGVQ